MPNWYALKKYSSVFIRVLHISDAICVVSTLWGLAWFLEIPWSSYFTFLAATSGALAFLMFYSTGVYRPWRGIRLYREIGVIAKSWMKCVGIILLLLFLTKTFDRFSRSILLSWFWITPLVIFCIHLVGRYVLRELRKLEFNMKSAVIVGVNHIGRRFEKGLRDFPWAGIKIVGYFDDVIPRGEVVSDGKKVLGDTSRLFSYCKRSGIDYVYVALPLKEQDRIFRLVNRIRPCGAQVLLVPDIFSFSLLSAELVSVGDIPLISFNPDFRWKRHFDIVFSLCALVLCLPLFVLIGLIIKIQDGGPILYGHNRITVTGKKFRCWKFRTMVPDAEKKLEQILENDPNASGEWAKGFKIKKDPRITRFGRFLRRTSLDELPQFWNILKGDMSVVGARPVIPQELSDFYKENAGVYCSVKPGLTGPWQIGKRNDTEDYQERVKLDVWYIQNCSPWLDLKIIGKTAWRVFRPNGAY